METWSKILCYKEYFEVLGLRDCCRVIRQQSLSDGIYTAVGLKR